jgi:segregation and condensation protein A
MDLNLTSRQAGRYHVQTPFFEGPLDLLLYLIERDELDITALALARVTEHYLDYIRTMEIGVDEISAFLVVAARLLQIKSEALLPRPPSRDPGELDSGAALVEQLRIYRVYKQTANWLHAQEATGLRTHLRLAPPPQLEPHLDLSNITPADLLAAAEAVFSGERSKRELGTVISAPKVTIREKITLIASLLARTSRAPFRQLLPEKPTRLEIVVTFLALLELVKRYRVTARQEGLFGEIAIERLEDWQGDDEIETEFD